jgi:hypothetical protein
MKKTLIVVVSEMPHKIVQRHSDIEIINPGHRTQPRGAAIKAA